MDTSYDTLLQYALKLISRKRYTEYELSKKLIAKKIGKDADHKRVIKRLKELKYIDDTSFARDYISTRILVSPRGKDLIKIELLKKGINEKIISSELEKANIDEEKLAKLVMQKRISRFQGLEKRKKKEKIMRFLLSRGFKFDTIYKVIDK